MSLIKLADKIKEAYEIISAKSVDGGVSPQDLVAYAKPEDSPLHDNFTWEDRHAAEQYRVQQARQLLKWVAIEVETDDGKKGKIGPGKGAREFQSVQVNPNDLSERKYFSVETIMSSPDLKKRMISQMVKEVRWMLYKYNTYKEIYRVINEPEVKALEAEIKKGLRK